MSKTLTPYAPVSSIMTQLAAAGWGEISGGQWQGVRSTLKGLMLSLDFKTGKGSAPLRIVAERSGLTVKWTRRCLCVLEDLGLISWRRGYVSAGQGIPSRFIIHKKALLKWIDLSRPSMSMKHAAARRASIERIRAIKALYVRPARKAPLEERLRLHTIAQTRQNTLSIQGELSSPISPLKREDSQSLPSENTSCNSPQPQKSADQVTGNKHQQGWHHLNRVQKPQMVEAKDSQAAHQRALERIQKEKAEAKGAPDTSDLAGIDENLPAGLKIALARARAYSRAQRVSCQHGYNAETCHLCVAQNTPPDGYAYDYSICTTCGHDETAHMSMIARRVNPDHTYRPRLIKLS